MNTPFFGDDVFVCHSCATYHPCANEQNYRDKVAAHTARGCTAFSRLNRDALADAGSRLAVYDSRKKLVVGFGWLGAIVARLRGGVRVPSAVVDRTRALLASKLPHLAGVIPHLSIEDLLKIATYTANADVKQALQALQTMTVTNLHSLANSATAGWQSAQVDNTANLYLDSLVQIVLDFANTAAANSRCAYIFAASGLETGVLSNPFSGSEGTVTLVDVTANSQNARQIGTIPYTTQNEVAESSIMSVASGSAMVLPPYWSLGLINHSGAALAASGNTVKYQGAYNTVV